MAAAIRESSTVMLKSGGPIMTVTMVKDNGTAVCTWFAGTKLEHGAFPLSALDPFDMS